MRAIGRESDRRVTAQDTRAVERSGEAKTSCGAGIRDWRPRQHDEMRWVQSPAALMPEPNTFMVGGHNIDA